MEKESKYYTPVEMVNKTIMSWLNEMFSDWEPEHIEPEEWTKYFFKLRIFPNVIHYSHRKNGKLMFFVYVDKDTQEEREKEWRETCVLELFADMKYGLKEKDVTKKYGDIMGKKEINEFVRLFKGQKETKGTVFYG